ncbi:MAG: VWA domain-containing protein [Turicibacter sp.]|nr:VWA domain-containing protein [Turicibacter sp.]
MNSSKKMNGKSAISGKWLKIIFGVFVLVVMTVFPKIVSAQEIGNPSQFDLDVIFVIDDSGSMIRMDPQDLSLEAANLFISLTSETDTRAGFVFYSDDRRQRNLTIPLTPVGDSVNASNVMNLARNTPGRREPAWTDVGWGLIEADRLLSERGDSQRQPVVILVTDSHIQMGSFAGETPDSRTDRDESIADIYRMTEMFANLGIRVHTIFFDFYQGNPPQNIIDNKEPELIEAIAENTGGTFTHISNAQQLPIAMSNIWAFEVTHFDIDDDGRPDGGASFQTVFEAEPMDGQSRYNIDIEIPNDSVAAANIIIHGEMSSLFDMRLFHPDGFLVDIIRDTNINITESDAFLMIRILNPARGNWRLDLPGTEDISVTVQLLNIYEITPFLEMNPSQPIQGETVIFTVGIIRSGTGEIIDDSAFISQYNPVLHIIDAAGQESTYPFNQGMAEVALTRPGIHSAHVVMDIRGQIQTSGETHFSVEPLVLVLETASGQFSQIEPIVFQALFLNPSTGEYRQIEAIDFGDIMLHITDPNGVQTQQTFGQGIQLPLPGEYTAYAVLIGYPQESETVSFTVTIAQENPLLLDGAIFETEIFFRRDAFLRLNAESYQITFNFEDWVESAVPGSIFTYHANLSNASEWENYFSIHTQNNSDEIGLTIFPNVGVGQGYVIARSQWGSYAELPILITISITTWWGDYWIFFAVAVVVVMLGIIFAIKSRTNRRVAAAMDIMLEYRNASGGDSAIFRRYNFRIAEEPAKNLQTSHVLVKDVLAYIVEYPEDGEANIDSGKKGLLANMIGDEIVLVGSSKYNGNPVLMKISSECSARENGNLLEPIPKKLELSENREIKLSWVIGEATATLTLIHIVA